MKMTSFDGTGFPNLRISIVEEARREQHEQDWREWAALWYTAV